MSRFLIVVFKYVINVFAENIFFDWFDRDCEMGSVFIKVNTTGTG